MPRRSRRNKRKKLNVASDYLIFSQSEPSKLTKDSVLFLSSADGDVFVVEKKVALQSKFLKDLSEGKPMPGYTRQPYFIACASNILKMILSWCVHHAEDPAFQDFPVGMDPDPEIPEWDKELFEVDMKTLQELVRDLRYMEVAGMFCNVCKAIAKRIEDRSVEELREMFDIVNDFNEDDEKKVREENLFLE